MHTNMFNMKNVTSQNREREREREKLVCTTEVTTEAGFPHKVCNTEHGPNALFCYTFIAFYSGRLCMVSALEVGKHVIVLLNSFPSFFKL